MDLLIFQFLINTLPMKIGTKFIHDWENLKVLTDINLIYQKIIIN